MFEFHHLFSILDGRAIADCQCPECMASCSPHGRGRNVLRCWRMSERAISYNCARCGASGSVTSGMAKTLSSAEWTAMERRKVPMDAEAETERERKRQLAIKIWQESGDSLGTLAQDYLALRNIRLPLDPSLRRRTIRYHPSCPFPHGTSGPALLAAFTPIHTDVPDDPFLDPQVTAIHRIRGRGHDNKAMLGPVKGKAVHFGEWEEVCSCGLLHVCEGVETALALLVSGVRPIWALGSAGAMEALPVIAYVRRLVIFADNDASGRGIEAAERLATRYADAGKLVDIFMPEREGADYGDV